MKRISTLTLAVCLFAAAVPAFAAVEGAWASSAEAKSPDTLYMNIAYGRHNNMGTTRRIADFAGLTSAQIHAATTTPVQFTMSREAGTITFEGTYRNGKGAGQFTFAPNRSYVSTLRALDVDFDLDRRKHENDDEETTLFTLALHDVSTAFIKSMQAEGYKTTLEKYLTMRIFDITPEFVREMRSLGFKNLDADDLVGSRIHKVTPAYVREMRAAGWDLSLEDLQATRIHGATPEFAAKMKSFGYALDIDDLVSFRIHKVTPEFIEELRQLGYRNVDADDLVAMRIHRVTPEFIREIEAAGYRNVPVDKLVHMRIHRIDAKMLKSMNE
jgi:hypothetical protein